MTMIKRYPNRKLYDTEAKQYITLDGIADLIRRGKEVTVIDHASGEDLTALTLTQIILEEEKKKGGLLPRTVLANLIQAGGDRLSALQRSLATPLNFWHQFDEEMKKRIQTMVKHGDLSENEGKSLLDKVLSLNPLANRSQHNLETDIERIITERQIPTHADLDHIKAQLDALSVKLDKLSE